MSGSDQNLVARVEDVVEGRTVKFEILIDGSKSEGFATRFDGKVVAYYNRCQHLPITLDFGDNEFFTNDGKFFICATHGAMYDPKTGLCVAGPCAGASLEPLSVCERNGELWLSDPGPTE